MVAATSACLEPDQARRQGITLVPLRVEVDGRDLRDLQEISPTEVYQLLRRGVRLRTSSPTPGDYAAAFEAEQGPVLCLTEGSQVSAINSSAGLAAQMVDPDRVVVVDTGTAAGGLRLLALAAARLAEHGLALRDLRQRMEELSTRVEMVGMLENVEFLARSGRIPEVAHWGASLLRVRPVIRFKAGRGSLVTLARTPMKGVQELQRLAVREVARQAAGPRGEGVHGTVFHGDTRELADELVLRLRHDLPCAELSLSEVTAAMVVHTGPGVMGHALYVDPQ